MANFQLKNKQLGARFFLNKNKLIAKFILLS